MKEHLEAFAPSDLAVLSDWLAEKGELYVDLDWPNIGWNYSVQYYIRTLHDLRELVAQQTWSAVLVVAFRNDPYPLRGLVDNEFVAQAKQLIQDGQYFQIRKLAGSAYPIECIILDDGNTHAELQAQLGERLGQPVAVGTNPFDYHLTDYFIQRPEEAFVLEVARDQRITKNWTSYPPYDLNPEKYQPLINAWNV